MECVRCMEAKKENDENPKLEDFCVKIEFPVDIIKKFIKNHNLKANLIAYTDLLAKEKENYIFVEQLQIDKK